MALIDESTFEGCRSLVTVDMPKKLRKIGRRAFLGCTSLASLILPVGVEAVGLDAFSGCSALRRIAIPKNIKELEDGDVFGGCDALAEISFGGSAAEWDSLTGGKPLAVECSDLTVRLPRVSCLDLKNEI